MDAAWVERVMDQAQVFASAWSLVGGPFDKGDGLERALADKDDLRQMLQDAASRPGSQQAGEPLTHADLLTLRGNPHG